jgi:hypothetical protein
MIEAVTLSRVSTSAQAGPDSISLDLQERICRQYATQNQIRIREVLRWIGSAFSSKSDHHDRLYNNLVKYRTPDRNLVLLVYNTSRFSRDLNRGLKLVSDLFNIGIRVYSVQEKFYLDSEEGLFRIKDSNQWAYRHSLQTTRYHSLIRYLGGDTGKIPYGYRPSRSVVRMSNRTIKKRVNIFDRQEQKILRFIRAASTASIGEIDAEFRAAIGNRTLPLKDTVIATILNRLGYRRRDGRRWKGSNIQYLRRRIGY